MIGVLFYAAFSLVLATEYLLAYRVSKSSGQFMVLHLSAKFALG